MNDSTGKLKTHKFKKLIDKPAEYFKALSELAIKQIKRSDIVVSRNKGQDHPCPPTLLKRPSFTLVG